MNTPPARSARPPRPVPDLTSNAARAFLGVDRVPEPALTPAPESTVAPQAPRRGKTPLRVISLRIPEEMHDKLARIAAATPHSMNAFIVAALAPAIEAELEKIRL